MKLTKKKLAYTILSVVFLAVVPLGLIAWQYSSVGEEAAAFKVGITGVMLVVAVFLMLKKIFFNRWLENQRAQINAHRADIKIETDAAKLENLERELRHAQTIECVLNAILPFVLFLGAILACKAMEAGVIRLGNVMAMITASYVVGVVFDVLAAREVVSKNRGV